MHLSTRYLPAALLALVAFVALLPSAAKAQPEDWAICAQEGEVCRTRGDALVRFGAEGHFAFRVTHDQQPCTVDNFGSDPLPNRHKRCEVSVNWRNQPRYRNWQTAGASQGEWTLCANEGDLCPLPPGEFVVRYGADGRYSEIKTNREIACNNGIFGDPMEGAAKQCAFKRANGEGANAGARPGLTWVPCAREGERCEFRGPAMVRYSAGRRAFYAEGFDGMVCINESFGQDPAAGQSKHCDLLRPN